MYAANLDGNVSPKPRRGRAARRTRPRGTRAGRLCHHRLYAWGEPPLAEIAFAALVL